METHAKNVPTVTPKIAPVEAIFIPLSIRSIAKIKPIESFPTASITSEIAVGIIF